MYELGEYPALIPHRSKRQGVRGYGKSQCEICDRTWSTYQAHVVIDLKKQEVVRIYQQKCRDCGTETEPYFPEDEFYVMIEKAIEQEKLHRYPSSQIRRVHEGGRRGFPRRPPHRSDLCERCGYGWGKKCWER
nr:uncharacterized protein LOC129255732 [Lytechinus pictus]